MSTNEASSNRAPVVAIIMLAVALNVASMLPALEPGAAIMRIAALGALMVALALVAVKNKTRRPRIAFTVAVAVAVICSVFAYNTVRATAEVPPIPSAFELKLEESSLRPVSERTVVVGEEDSEHVIDTAVSAAENSTAIECARADALLSAARGSDYTPRSGLVPNWDAGTVTRMAGTHYVTVPLTGTDLPEITRLVFVHDANGTQVIEMAADVVDATHAHLDMWENGAMKTSVTAEDPSTANVAQAGFKWTKFNDCLSGSGIHGWTIALLSGVCGAVCVGTAGTACGICLAAVIGGSAGTIMGCVQVASR